MLLRVGMWWQGSVFLTLISLFCTWFWIVHLPPIDTQNVITTKVEVSVIGKSMTSSGATNNSKKNFLQPTDKSFEIADIHKKKHLHTVPQFMLDLYEEATATRHSSRAGSGRVIPDVVRGLTPRTTASVLEPDNTLEAPSGDRRHLLVFDVPRSTYGEILQSAELRILLTAVQQRTSLATDEQTGAQHLVHVHLLDEHTGLLELGVRHVFQRHGDTWLSFNVTAAVMHPTRRTQLRLLVHIRATCPHNEFDLALVLDPQEGRQLQDVQPLLLLSYSALTAVRHHMIRNKRDAEDYEEESNNIWDDDRAPAGTGLQARRAKRQRNTCRRRPLYVDFSEIHYDTWIVAPNGYEAFQCTGKCFFPVSEHLSPTKHAIVQTLLHSVSPGKVSRACCVPTRLEPISVLYVDQKGVLTYRFSYQDMVVAECGCR